MFVRMQSRPWTLAAVAVLSDYNRMFVYMQLCRHLFLLCLISPQDIFLMHDKDKTQRLEYQEVMPSLKAAGSIHNTFSSCVI